MSIISITRWPGLDAAGYDALVERAGLRDDPPAGGTVHLAALDGDGMIFINVWESREAQEAGALTAPFEIDDYTRWRLLEGLDDVGHHALARGRHHDVRVHPTVLEARHSLGKSASGRAFAEFSQDARENRV